MEIVPTKHYQSEVHNLMVLIERANETNDNSMPDKNILAISYEEISKDPRKALRITALNCQEQQVPLEEVLIRLLASAGAAPMKPNRENTLNGIQNSNIILFSISGKQMSCQYSISLSDTWVYVVYEYLS